MNDGYDDLGPGLHILREAEPLKRASAMAASMRADLCATLAQADATLADRSSLPTVDAPTLATLEVLSRRVARAERIAARTRERAVAEVGERLAGTGAGLAVHPTTIRERAAAVESARATLAQAEGAFAAATAEAAAVEVRDEPATASDHVAPPGPASEVDGDRPARRSPLPRVRRSRALGVLIGSFGVALLLLGVNALPLWAALLVPLAAALWALRYLQPRDHDDAADRQAASSLLAEVGASTEERFGARRAVEELADRTALLEADRNRAAEELRLAERAWHELAGAETEVADVEAVVRRFDPQHADAALLASETTGVRAADVVVHQFRQRWVASWSELGLAAPDATEGERAVDELSARVRRPVVLVGPAAARGPELARAAPAAPVVVLEGPIGEGAAVVS